MLTPPRRAGTEERIGAVPMAFEYINRCGEVYFLQAQQRKEKASYSATRKPKGATLDRVPDGYEIYERPEDAQVFVRKIRPSSILPLERQLVEASIRKLAKLEFFLVVADGDSIVVYPPLSRCVSRCNSRLGNH